ncbi:hypothetical protein [uncultured Streptomyces sp.]|uniref:hypothetical protein n=1 Tax=uncultured Streptomyces sp. TaxID=174707 RepID=UPI002608A90F|nr:hypothetical protein [uncultured Streptomyces sp.]
MGTALGLPGTAQAAPAPDGAPASSATPAPGTPSAPGEPPEPSRTPGAPPPDDSDPSGAPTTPPARPSSHPALSPSAPPSSAPAAGPSSAARPAAVPSAPSDDAEASGTPGAGPAEAGSSTPPLAGREAAQGRPRPGRSLSPQELARAAAALERASNDAEEEPEEFEEPDDARVAATPSDATEDAVTTAPPKALSGPAAAQLRDASLGVGISLVGLGLAFLAFRLRRAG